MKASGLTGWILVLAAVACIVGLDLLLVSLSARGLPATIPSEDAYNQLVVGFESGHLYLPAEVPAALKQLPDPWDPSANEKFRTQPPWAFHDLTYYQGRIYLYFGVTPAVLVFWPWHLLTGNFLSQSAVVAAFSIAGYLMSAALLLCIWRQRFPAVPPWVAAGALIVLGTATGVPMLDARPSLWEVPIACGYALSALALGAAWLSWGGTSAPKRLGWLAVTGLAGGLAVGARPTLLFGMTALAAGAALGKPSAGRRSRLVRLAAAFGPMVLIGLGLALYNQGRFGDPLQFGQHDQLSGDNVHDRPVFSASFVPENLYLYLLEPLGWGPHFPFAWAPSAHGEPGAHGDIECVIGLLPALPVLLLALAAPLAWRGRPGTERSGLRPLAAILGFMAVAGVAVLSLFYGACNRYQIDYLPACSLLACLGLFGLALRIRARGKRRLAACALAGALIAYSGAASTGASFARCLYFRNLLLGRLFMNVGRPAEAIPHLEESVRWSNGHAGCTDLGIAYLRARRYPEAAKELADALRLDPGNYILLNDLGVAEIRTQDYSGAIRDLTEVVRLRPKFTEGKDNLAAARFYAGQTGGE